jgi:hypothetical protein
VKKCQPCFGSFFVACTSGSFSVAYASGSSFFSEFLFAAGFSGSIRYAAGVVPTATEGARGPVPLRGRAYRAV